MLISGESPRTPSASASSPSPLERAKNLKLMHPVVAPATQVLSYVSFPSNFADPYTTWSVLLDIMVVEDD